MIQCDNEKLQIKGEIAEIFVEFSCIARRIAELASDATGCSKDEVYETLRKSVSITQKRFK